MGSHFCEVMQRCDRAGGSTDDLRETVVLLSVFAALACLLRAGFVSSLRFVSSQTVYFLKFIRASFQLVQKIMLCSDSGKEKMRSLWNLLLFSTCVDLLLALLSHLF